VLVDVELDERDGVGGVGEVLHHGALQVVLALSPRQQRDKRLLSVPAEEHVDVAIESRLRCLKPTQDLDLVRPNLPRSKHSVSGAHVG